MAANASSSHSNWKGIAPNLRERVRGGVAEWQAIVRVNGEQRTKKVVAANRTEAKKALPAVLALLNGSTGVAVGDRSVTLEGLFAAWVEREEGPNGKLAANTLKRHKAVLAKHVVPTLRPHTRAADLTVGHVRRMIDTLTTKGLKGGSVRVCVSALSTVLDFAVRNESLTRNVCRDLVRGDLPSGARTTEPRYLTIEQVTRLFEALSIEFRPVAEVLFYAGLRISEALALRWRDVDFEGGTLDVCGTKTKASKARIPLHPTLAAVLREHRADQGRIGVHRIAADALVFPTATGKAQSRRNALRAISNASVRAGLVQEGEEKVGCHDLRHSLAANAFEMGLSDVEVARVLRHANSVVTRTVYGGITDSGLASLSTKLASVGGAS